MLHGTGIFTYKTGSFIGSMLVNLPAPWSIWAWKVKENVGKPMKLPLFSSCCLLKALAGKANLILQQDKAKA